ncbi:MAG: hypothetical protein HQM13_22330 [SAR324 cluster bacterium]|nr:hypothetical protein [SAR324 cluster bacterium]
MQKFGLCIAVLILLAGCYNRVQFPSETPSDEKVEHTDIFLFWGLAGEANYELYEDCPNGSVYEIYARTGIFQGILTVLSVGVYSPRSIEITCSGKTHSAVETMEKSANKTKQNFQKSTKSSKSASDSMPPLQEKSPKAFDLN